MLLLVTFGLGTMAGGALFRVELRALGRRCFFFFRLGESEALEEQGDEKETSFHGRVSDKHNLSNMERFWGVPSAVL